MSSEYYISKSSAWVLQKYFSRFWPQPLKIIFRWTVSYSEAQILPREPLYFFASPFLAWPRFFIKMPNQVCNLIPKLWRWSSSKATKNEREIERERDRERERAWTWVLANVSEKERERERERNVGRKKTSKVQNAWRFKKPTNLIRSQWWVKSRPKGLSVTKKGWR